MVPELGIGDSVLRLDHLMPTDHYGDRELLDRIGYDVSLAADPIVRGESARARSTVYYTQRVLWKQFGGTSLGCTEYIGTTSIYQLRLCR